MKFYIAKAENTPPLYMHSSKRTTEQLKRLKALYMNGNCRIHRAWVLSYEFEHFWEFDNQMNAKEFLDNWCKTANKSRLEPSKKFTQLTSRGIMYNLYLQDARLKKYIRN